MALIIKTSATPLFAALAVNPLLVSQVEALGVKFAVGSNSLKAYDGGNDLLFEIVFDMPSHQIIKDGGTATLKSLVEAKLDAVVLLSQADSLVVAKLVDPKFVSPTPQADPKKQFVHVATLQEKPAQAVSDSKEKSVIHLRDAQKLYQRVFGSSPGAVYVVVAVSKTAKVAAKYLGGVELSVRVECKDGITPKVAEAFGKNGLTKKSDQYMSGHFKCGNVSPQRVLGAVLLGSGIRFDTPIPDFSKVQQWSKSGN